MSGRVPVADDDRPIRESPRRMLSLGGFDARRDRLLAGTCLTLLAGVAALWMITRPGVPGLDSWLHRAVLQHRGATSLGIARTVTQGGSTLVVWPLLVLATLVHPRTPDRKGRLAAGTFTATVGAVIGVRLVVSILIARPRPPAVDWAGAAGGYAFPSGHTTAATIGAGALAWSVARRTSRPGVRLLAWGTAAAYAAAVGWSRIWLGVHWPMDVAGGWLLGAGWLTGMAWGINRPSRT